MGAHDAGSHLAHIHSKMSDNNAREILEVTNKKLKIKIFGRISILDYLFVTSRISQALLSLFWPVFGSKSTNDLYERKIVASKNLK